jgi:NADH-quinone oxidoreductase subunit H
VITDVNIGVLFVLAVSSVGVLALDPRRLVVEFEVRFARALRSSAQMVSYEVSMGLAIIGA